MSKYIYANIRHVNDKVSYVTNVYMQLDNLPVPETLYYEGVSPVERYAGYITGIYDAWQTDIVTEMSNADPRISSVDPVTNTNYQYRVISIPESFPDSHMELVADLYRQ